MKKGFAFVLILFIVLALILVAAGYFYLNKSPVANLSSNFVHNQLNSQKQASSTPNKPAEAFVNLSDVYAKLKSENKLNECHNNCFPEFFSEAVKQKIALDYKLIDKVDTNSPVFIALLRGGSADIPGIGTGYLENKKIINLQKDNWYWEVGSCATNKRVYIDAATGQISSPIHHFVYCGGTP